MMENPKIKTQNSKQQLKSQNFTALRRGFALCALRFEFKRGFTLLEIVIAVSIITLIGTIAVVSFINSRNIRDLNVALQNTVSILKLAQSKTIGGEENSPWGVHLEQTRTVLFRGATYAASTSTQTNLLSGNIEIVNINLTGGGPDVIFKKLSGKTDQDGSFTLRVKTAVSQSLSVTIDSSGKVYQASTALSPTGTRIVDARHRNFNLGWSIKNSATLTLTFSDPPNPDTVVNVTMNPAAPRITFDWQGVNTIGGQSQTLRIHALSITDTNTTLSADRDCRLNTKKVKISVDAKDIATYEANCQTVTVGTFGGIISEP